MFAGQESTLQSALGETQSISTARDQFMREVRKGEREKILQTKRNQPTINSSEDGFDYLANYEGREILIAEISPYLTKPPGSYSIEEHLTPAVNLLKSDNM